MNLDACGILNPVIRKLEKTCRLSDKEADALASPTFQLADCPPEQVLLCEGDRPSRCFALLEGFACTFKSTRDGRRQIVAFHFPGDFPDLQNVHQKVADTGIATLTSCKVAFIQHEVIRGLCENHPRIAIAFWRETLTQAAICREWMTNIGQRNAPVRIAHLLCEALVRMQTAGLAEGHTCRFPITQVEIADATGMSSVHVNRSLQDLRGRGWISLKGEQLMALDWPALRAFAEFDPTYLHLEQVE